MLRGRLVSGFHHCRPLLSVQGLGSLFVAGRGTQCQQHLPGGEEGGRKGTICYTTKPG